MVLLLTCRQGACLVTAMGVPMSDIVLRFRDQGPAYERAKAVADAIGLSVDAYLLACIREGNRVLRERYLGSDPDLEEPAFERRGVVLEIPDE